MKLREKIKEIVYHEQDVDAILSAVRKALPKKRKLHNDLCIKSLGNGCDCGLDGYNSCLSDIIKLLE